MTAPSKPATIAQAVEQRPFLTFRQLRRWVQAGTISSWKAGGFVLVDLDEIDAMIAASHRPAGGAK